MKRTIVDSDFCYYVHVTSSERNCLLLFADSIETHET